MQNRIYHWRHGWIPLDHIAAMSKAKGNRALAARYLARYGGTGTIPSGSTKTKTRPGLHPVSQKSLPRRPHIVAAYRDKRFVLSDKKTGHKVSISESRAGDLSAFNYTVTEIGPSGFTATRNSREYKFDETGKRLPSGLPQAKPTAKKTTDGDKGIAAQKPRTIAEGPEREARRREMARGLQPRGTVRSMEFASGEKRWVYTAKDGSVQTFATQDEANDAAAWDQAKRAPDTWKSVPFAGDGSEESLEAGEKIKQSFILGNHRVYIESSISAAQTKEMLADIEDVIKKAGKNLPPQVTFHVPTGDKNFRSRRRGTVLGYVHLGRPTVFLNPKVANGSLDKLGTSNKGGFMPAAAGTTVRKYTLAHELGHVMDGSQNHTHGPTTRTASGLPIPGGVPAAARDLHTANRSNLSRYGRTNMQEGYAEAWAQWMIGGPGSSVVSDEYARRFGWITPTG